MTSKGGMKVLFDPPKEKEGEKEKVKKEEGEEEDNLLGGFKGIGEMKQFTANGGIEITGKDKDGRPIIVRGNRAVYDAKTKKVILRGSTLSFLVANVGVRSSNKDAYIVVTLLGGENISAQTNGGGWEISLPDDINKKK